jgi:hypothetical protein
VSWQGRESTGLAAAGAWAPQRATAWHRRAKQNRGGLTRLLGDRRGVGGSVPLLTAEHGGYQQGGAVVGCSVPVVVGTREQDEGGGSARNSGPPTMCTARADKTRQIFVSAVPKGINCGVISGPVIFFPKMKRQSSGRTDAAFRACAQPA